MDLYFISGIIITLLMAGWWLYRQGRNTEKEKQHAKASNMKHFIILGLALNLGACGAVGMNKQQYAGITHWQVSGNQTTEGTWQITDVQYTNGKEEDSSEIAISLNGGDTILNFSGAGIKAFEGQALRAEVDKVVAETVGENIPGLTDAILKVLVP